MIDRRKDASSCSKIPDAVVSGGLTIEMKNKLGVAATLILAASTVFAQTSSWKIDPAHSAAAFTVRHMGISNVHGRFSNLAGTVTLNDGDISKSTVNATVDVSTVDTGNSARDGHLKSPDFFDVAHYPQMSFASKQIVKKNEKLSVIGDLTLHGVTRQVELALDGPSKDAADGQGHIHRGFSAEGTINRQDFGMKFAGTTPGGDAMVGDEIKIELDVELVKQ
jgi:polyisoprenoid-binding protein YceI